MQAEEDYRSLVESLDHAVFRLDLQGVVTYINPAIQTLSGYAPDDVVGKSFAGFIYPDDLAGLQASFKRTLAGHSEPYEFRVFARDGTVRWVRTSSRAEVKQGQVVGATGVLADITERKLAEEELFNSRQMLRSVLDNIPQRVFWKDRNSVFVGCNQPLAIDCGYDDPSELIGKTDYETASAATAERYRADDREVMETGRPKLNYEEPQIKPDGSQAWLITNKVPRLDQNGNIIGVLGTYEDVTESRRLERQLREAQKMDAIGRLAGGIAHDFNNLMTVITGYSELLRAALGDNAGLCEKVDEIHEAGKQASILTRQLLAFSRRQMVQPEILNLNEVLGRLANMLRRLVSEDIELRIVPGPALHQICCDPGQIEQVVMNLVINARDAMPNGGKLTLRTENVAAASAGTQGAGVAAAGFVRLTVSDTGTGMPAETQVHIFEPFFTTKEVGKGTGLGLATVYGIVRQAGGHIAVESELGKGTTFRLDFPPAAEEPPRSSTSATEIPVPTGGPLGGVETILVVEDQEGLRKLLAEILQRHGYTVLSAAEGREALRLAEAYPDKIDLILTDLVMPQMGGRELVEALPPCRSETKVLYMSGYADKAGDAAKLASRHFAFIEKPFQPETLLYRIRKVLDTPQDIEAERELG